MWLKASSNSKRKRSNPVLALGPKGFIMADSGKLLGDYFNTTKDMIKNCLRQPSRYREWYIYYDDIEKRMTIREKMLKKKSIRNPEYMKYLDILDEYEFESVETIYAFVRGNIGKFYQLDYDFIDENGVPYLLEVFCDEDRNLYSKISNDKIKE